MRLPEPVLQPQIDEARPGDVGRRDVGVGAQGLGQLFRQRARVLAGGLRQHHRRIGGKVAMARIARRLDRDAGQIHGTAVLVFQIKGFDSFYDPRVEIGEDIHWVCSGF